MGSSKRSWSARVGVDCLRTALSAALFVCLFPAAAFPQTAQQRVYGSASATTTTSILPAYNKDGTTGALALLPGAPFADRLEGGLIAIDGQGKFLFVLNPVSDNISMFQIDGSTGTLTEVPNSPFAAGQTVNPSVAPSQPISLAAEKSGSFLYVGYANGNSNTTSALVPFAIDAANLRLILTPQLSLDFGNGAPVQMQADPKGLHLYVGLGPGGNQTNASAGTLVFSIDASSGVLTQTGAAGGGTNLGRSIAVDPHGRFFFDGWGQTQGFLDSGVISPVDGTSGVSFTLNLGPGIFPSVLIVDASGKFLYAQTGAGLLIYAIDATSGELTLLNGPLAQISFGSGKVAADPMGPFLYSLGRSGVDVFQIDAQSGNLTEIEGAPFSTGSSSAGSQGLAISGTAIQSVSGPAAQVFPSTVDFGQIVVGGTSNTKIVSVVNVGDQTLAISGISISGVNAGDFSQSNTCGATVAPNANCSVSILFSPSQTVAEHASLQVSTNAPGSPQSAGLTGTGVATQGGVTLAPGSVDFGLLAQGATVSRNIQITNSGSGVLHISSVALSGSNPNDFSQTNNCVSAAIAVHASCLITVSFAPQSQGQRTASLVITDDGAGSPQSVALSGGGAAPFQLTLASGSTSAAVSAGQTAQYALQALAGPGFTGSVSLTCSGAPLAATCSVTPNNISLSGSSATLLQVSVATTGSALVSPPGIKLPQFWIWPLALVFVVALSWVWFLVKAKAEEALPPRIAYAAILLGATLFTAAGCGGGGGGTSNATPQSRTATPHGTTTLIVAAQSGTLPPETLQLTLTVN